MRLILALYILSRNTIIDDENSTVDACICVMGTAESHLDKVRR